MVVTRLQSLMPSAMVFAVHMVQDLMTSQLTAMCLQLEVNSRTLNQLNSVLEKALDVLMQQLVTMTQRPSMTMVHVILIVLVVWMLRHVTMTLPQLKMMVLVSHLIQFSDVVVKS
jgi:hypothetical protein